MSIPPLSEGNNVLAIAIMEMCRMKKGAGFSPEEVVMWIYPESWHHFMEEVLEEMMNLYRSGKINVTQEDHSILMDRIPSGKLSITSKF